MVIVRCVIDVILIFFVRRCGWMIESLSKCRLFINWFILFCRNFIIGNVRGGKWECVSVLVWIDVKWCWEWWWYLYFMFRKWRGVD